MHCTNQQLHPLTCNKMQTPKTIHASIQLLRVSTGVQLANEMPVGLIFLCSSSLPAVATPLPKHVTCWYLSWIAFYFLSYSAISWTHSVADTVNVSYNTCELAVVISSPRFATLFGSRDSLVNVVSRPQAGLRANWCSIADWDRRFMYSPKRPDRLCKQPALYSVGTGRSFTIC